ncbi:hypothetical protein [Streptomyces tendae]|uniref:hypothetical protein n=1 Tax=Streptomyces tendae TaxID=1932 RepID=UPI003D741B99
MTEYEAVLNDEKGRPIAVLPVAGFDQGEATVCGEDGRLKRARDVEGFAYVRPAGYSGRITDGGEGA